MSTPQRRRLLGRGRGRQLGPWSSLSLAATGNASGRRFVLVILRGGMDGLSARARRRRPRLRGGARPLGQFATPALALDGPFALHPNLAQLHAMYGRGELAVVHAVGLPYRERSHFDAQQVLESGGTRPYELTTGWLGRALGASGSKGMALNTAVPLVLRGRAVVDTWAPSALPDPSADLVARLERMYAGDPALATALERARALHLDAPPMRRRHDMRHGRRRRARARAGTFVALAQRAAEFLAQPNGPQAAVLELGGWDTHANQANPNGALANGLRQLDAGLAALRDGLVERRRLEPHGRRRRQRVRPRGRGQRHARHRPRHRRRRLRARRRRCAAAASSPTGRAWPKATASKAATCSITTDLRAVLKGVLADHLQVARAASTARCFLGQRRSGLLS